jgi:hypothetical protein
MRRSVTKLTLAASAVNYGAAVITTKSETAMTTFQIFALAMGALACLGIMLVLARRQVRRTNEAAARRAALARVGPGRGQDGVEVPAIRC